MLSVFCEKGVLAFLQDPGIPDKRKILKKVGKILEHYDLLLRPG